MLKYLLGLDDVGEIGRMAWGFRLPWPLIVLVIALVAMAVYALLLYRRERGVSRGKRGLLGVLRAAVLMILVTLLFEPVLAVSTSVELPRTVLVLLDVSESMNIRDHRRRPEQQRDAAVALGLAPSDPNAPVSPEDLAAASNVSRMDLAKALLRREKGNVFEELAKTYRVRYFAFGSRLAPAEGTGEPGPEALDALDANDPSTRLGTAMEEALARFSGQSISGVVALTDGASNEGVAPMEVARRMKERAVPFYPVGLGLARPTDVRLDAVIVPETVFVKDKVPVRVQFSSTGLAGKDAEIIVQLDGRDVAVAGVTLEDAPQYAELLFQPLNEAEAAELEIEVRPVSAAVREASESNSRTVRTIRIIDEKIKVLYIEGKPRWEYRYLRRVLLRDHRLDVKFFMTEGDKELAKYSDRYLAAFPMDAERAFRYDLVILGDVPASRLTRLEMERMEELVRDRGGSFLLLAGSEHAPHEFVGTPIEQMLPVTPRPDGVRQVDDMVHPQVTAEGAAGAVAMLEYPEDRNAALWSRVRPLFYVPRLEGMKRGATPLLTLSNTLRGDEPYPLVCWHRHRSGKVMYVGTDQLWRLRFKRGDELHARFWGQAIQFLTLSRLLSGNRRIRVETDRTDYRVGERVQISANVLDEAWSPVLAQSFRVRLQRQDGDRERRQISLSAVPGMPGLFRGFFSPEQQGQYELTAAEGSPDAANVVRINVAGTSLERQEPALQEDELREMVGVAGGRYFTAAESDELADELAGETRRTSVRLTKELFDLPIIFGLVLTLLAIEWFIRRRGDLV